MKEIKVCNTILSTVAIIQCLIVKRTFDTFYYTKYRIRKIEDCNIL